MEDKVKIPAPVTTSNSLEGISKDVQYLRRDVDEMKLNHEKYHKEVMQEIRSQSTSFVVKAEFIDAIKTIEDHEKRLRALEESVKDLALIRRIVYGLVTLILTTVVVAIIGLVVINK